MTFSKQSGPADDDQGTLPRRQNLGCGSLLLIFLVVALVGKFMPHSAGTSEKPSVRVSQSRGTPPVSSKAPVPHDVPEAVGAGETASRMITAVWGVMDDLMAGSRVTSTGGTVGGRLGDRPDPHDTAPPTGSGASQSAAVKVHQPTVRMPESSGASDGVGFVSDVMGVLATLVGSDESEHPPPGLSAEKKPNALPVKGKPGGIATQEKPDASRSAVSAKNDEPDTMSGAVINSPWNGSVEQVEHYLRRHTHDADSMEFIEWGKVRQTSRGFEVRCTFRSRNVLGKVATQSKNFLLTPEGDVSDIRD